VELTQLSNHDLSGYFEVAEGLLGTVEHEEATADVVETCHCVN